MRKVAAVLFFIAALGMLAPPAFAQAPAPAPAPKVTINGLVDFVATYYSNWSGTGGGGGLNSSDVTNPRDKGWYTRERGVFTITGEVGRSRGVWAVELDFTNGAGQTANSGSAFNGGLQRALDEWDLGKLRRGHRRRLGRGDQVALHRDAGHGCGVVPPVDSLRQHHPGRWPAGARHDYKNGILLSGDFPGATLQTNWTPDIRSTVAFVQHGREARSDHRSRRQPELGRRGRASRWTSSRTSRSSPRMRYSWMHGGSCNANSGTTNPGAALGNPTAGGVQLNDCGTPAPLFAADDPAAIPSAATYGGSSAASRSSRPFSISSAPFQTFVMGPGQFINPVTGLPNSFAGGFGKRTEDINAFIFDTIAGYRIGPLNLQARAMFTSGQNAQSNIQNGADLRYYRAINSAFGYMAGWTDIQTGGVDYITAAMVGIPGLVLRESPSYDKYGRIFFGLASDYALTPALTFTGLGNASFTPYKVNTRSILTAQRPGTVPRNHHGRLRKLHQRRAWHRAVPRRRSRARHDVPVRAEHRSRPHRLLHVGRLGARQRRRGRRSHRARPARLQGHRQVHHPAAFHVLSSVGHLVHGGGMGVSHAPVAFLV